MLIGPISSAYIPQVSASSIEDGTAIIKPDLESKAMSFDSHLRISNAIDKTRQAASALDNLAIKLQNAKVTLETLRNATYERTDKSSERGTLKKEATKEDHQKYNHLLNEFGTLESNIKQRTVDNAYLNTELLLQTFKAQPLHGDIKRLTGPEVPAYIYRGAALISSQDITQTFESITHATLALDELAARLTEFNIDLKDLRLSTYENIDVRTNREKVPLTAQTMAVSHQQYISKLSEFNALRNETQELSKNNSFFNTDSILYIDESSPIYGDLQALKNNESIPDFRYSDRAGSMDIDFSKPEEL